MKFIHTGDWHIGKVVNEFSMIEDQKHVLNELMEIIEEEKPDALVIAGDLYDRSIPPIEAVELLDRTLSKILLEYQVPILAIAGNHDSAERLSFGNSLFPKNGLHIVGGIVGKEVKKITIQGMNDAANFYLVPYMDPKALRHIFEQDEITTHDEAMRSIIHLIHEDFHQDEINVMITHGYVGNIHTEKRESLNQDPYYNSGLLVSDSERPLSIGGTDLVHGKYFNCFHYTALGHLHRPQNVKENKIRYAGSLLKYSASEVNHAKEVTIVTIEGKNVQTRTRELHPLRDMRIIRGPLKELIDPSIYEDTNTEDYIFAVLTNAEDALLDPISKLRSVYPNIMGLTMEREKKEQKSKTAAGSGYQNKTKVQLFQEFYQAMTGLDLPQKKLKIVQKVVERVERSEGIETY